MEDEKTCLENMEGRHQLGNLRVDKRMILKLILNSEDVDWIHLVPDRIQWRELVEMGMNHQVA